MPRDGSQIYAIPVGTEGIPDTTIESARYNAFCADVEQDLNLPRPIIAGGTGATSSTAAIQALGAEVASQLVTNYDQHAFVSGSFHSDNTATNSPLAGGYFYGTAIVYDGNNTLLRATQMSGNGIAQTVTYLREKSSTGWGAWTTVASPNDKVSKSGDTMTGSLTITATQSVLSLNKSVATDYNLIYGTLNGVAQWRIDLSDAAGNFALHRWLDGGTYAGSPFSIDRASGNANFNNAVGIAGACTINGTLTATGAANVSGALGVGGAVNATGAVITAQHVQASTHVMAGAAGGTGTYHFGSSGVRYITYDGANTSFVNLGGVYLNNVLNCTSINCGSISSSGNLSVAGTISSGGDLNVSGNNIAVRGVIALQNTGDGFTNVRTGNDQSNGVRLGGSSTGWLNRYYAEAHEFYNLGSVNTCYIQSGRFDINGDAYKPGGGVWNDNSDIRVKNVIGDYTAGLDEIISLAPKRYTFKGNDTRSAPEEGATAPYANSLHYHPAESGKEFVGLIAQEAELVMPELVKKVSGYIDGTQVNDVRELDTTALIFALVNAVRQLTARIEDLEATR